MYLSGRDAASLFGFYLDVKSLFIQKKTGFLSLSVCDCACECARNMLQAFAQSVEDIHIDMADDS